MFCQRRIHYDDSEFSNQEMPSHTEKITDILQSSSFSFSFEVTPDIEEDELKALSLEPAFFSVTWHAKSHQCRDLDIPPLRLACRLRNEGKKVLLHLSCDLLKTNYLNQLLVFLQERGLCNLFVILGEKFDLSVSDFKSSQDLVRYIKNKSGDYFCIGVAGYPGQNEMLPVLKEKFDSGADFIITQAFFEAHLFESFVQDCRHMKICVPILPGLFLFESIEQLKTFAKICKVNVSQSIPVLVSSEGKHVGSEIIGKLIENILKLQHSVNIHFFTLNKCQQVCNFLQVCSVCKYQDT